METTKYSVDGSMIIKNYYKSSKPLNFKLKRHSFPEMKFDSCKNKSSSIESLINFSGTRHSVSSNSETLNSIGKKRKFSLNTHLVPRSVCLNTNAILKERVMRPNFPDEQPLDYHALSLNSNNLRTLLNDSEGLKSTVDREISQNNVTFASKISQNDSTVVSESKEFESFVESGVFYNNATFASEISQSNSTVVSEVPMNNSTIASECSTYELDFTKNKRSSLIWSQISVPSSAVPSIFESISDEEIEASIKDEEIEVSIKDEEKEAIIKDVVPIFNGYQLIGDSQLLRFSQKILGLQREFTHSSSGSLGLCVSGQTIADLHRRIKENFHPVGEQVILLIGTNDLLKGTTTSNMCRGLTFLIQDILLSAKKLIVLTLPPVPKLARSEDHWNRLDAYNGWIKSLPENYQGKLTVGDISPFFYRLPSKFCRLNFFEKWFYGGRRKDLIHINEEGFQVIKSFLLKQIL
ncbi:hypothetical protein LSTR_LSTR005976 [Laodelphax striatellus]|uniref:OSK domain-containing protein n=1 Tax=Laodelphax striatellus TaxID=195883 RepID=A0A482XPB9_LAOST|nr:hypothetical protein LSTR_LSTR005976 [Laodelphax striatellus]